MSGDVSPLLRTGEVRQSVLMANAITTRVRQEDHFRAVQLLPAPATVLALVLAAQHDLGTAPLGLIAVVGALATIGSALLPMVRPAAIRRSMPAPTETDRYREDAEHP
jgi:hypothetical protein